MKGIEKEYMNKSFILGFKTAIKCIDIDIKKTADKWKADTLTSLTKRLKKVLTMYGGN